MDNHSPSVINKIVYQEEQGQRIDNFLLKILKGVPKSRIYKAIRGGEVRINGSRVKAFTKIRSGDNVRIPPLRVAAAATPVLIPPKFMDNIPILYEDDHILVVSKPAGLAVHGGTGMEFGLIEALRQWYQTQSAENKSALELVHRLDRDTSGCLMLAKNRLALLALNKGMGDKRSISKYYKALVIGLWDARKLRVTLPLMRKKQAGKDKHMVVDSEGQKSLSIINTLAFYAETALVQIELKTGRMHQARVHCAANGYPIAGDRLYGDRGNNREFRKMGLGRMFLHASRLDLIHPIDGQHLNIHCPLPDQLQAVLDQLQKNVETVV